MNEVLHRNPSSLSRVAGAVTGGAAGVMADPLNIATLPLGAGAVQAGLKGFSFARAVMKAALIDGTINAGVEAINQPAIMAWQNELGRRYGFGDAAENVALAFVGGAGLSGAIRGGARGAKAGADYVGSISADILDRVASSEKIPPSVRDAAAFLSRQAHIDESAPPGSIKSGADLKAHRDTAQKIAEDFEGYRSSSATAPMAAASDLDSLTASRSKASAMEAPAGGVTQPSPERMTMVSEPSSFSRNAKILPSSEKGAVKVGDIDNTSQATIYHTTKKVDNLLKKAAELLPEVDRITEQLSISIQGLKQYKGRVKDADSLKRKMARKGRGAHTMSDVVGGRLVAESPRAIKDAVKSLGDNYRVIEVDDKLGRSAGYRATHVIIASDKGISAEIQIQPREIREVQDIAHEKFYKKYEQYEKAGKMDIPDKLRDQYRADMRAQDALFDEAWQRWLDRTEGFSDMVPAERASPVALPEGLSPEISADRVAIAESDMRALVDELGDEVIALDDGRSVSVRDYAEEIQAKKKVIEAMKTCRIS